MKERVQRWMEKLNGPWHRTALYVYMVIVFGHWSEHLAQAYQVYVLGWVPQQAGGVLGLWYPLLVQSEVLHIAYNGSMWLGLLLLLPGLTGACRSCWLMAIGLQSWHFLEHVLLQYQYLTGNYWFGGAQQTSVLQQWVPRVELHLLYNLMVFIPLVVAYLYYFYRPGQSRRFAPGGVASG